MNKQVSIVTALLVVAASLAASATGCELIASVDRSKIPGTGGAGGAGGAAVTSSTGGTSTSSSSSGTPCDGSMECQGDGDCTTSNACETGSCASGCCTTTPTATGTACNSGGGKVCDGNGNCVACNVGSDCAAQATACVVNTCSNNTCGTMKASAGTTCTDSSGDKVCDGNGNCVACNGNSDCTSPTVCDTTTHTCVGCNMPSDCGTSSTACKSFTCTNMTCGTSDASQGTACSDSGGKVCNATGSCVQCNTTADCSSGLLCDTTTNTCVQCLTAADCPGASCNGSTFTPASTCTNNTCSTPTPQTCPDQCNATSGCVQCNTSADCSPSCSNGQLAPATCTGNTCGTGTPAACTGGFVCANATSCKTACSGDADCESSSDYCMNPGASGTCVAKVTAGTACSANDQCTTGLCGTTGTGHCCTATCSASVPACGATDCDMNGDCVYPGTSVEPASLQGGLSGTCQAEACDGAGGDELVDDSSNVPTSTTLCLIEPACCGPSPLTPCFTPAPTGKNCTADGTTGSNGLPNQVCGSTANSDIAGTCVECNKDSDCSGATYAGAGDGVCDTFMGTCASCVPSGDTVDDSADCGDCCNNACTVVDGGGSTTCQ